MSTILLAEDDPDIRQLLAVKLRGSGFEVVETADGDEALDAVRRARPDLVVLDVRMPRLSGLEVLRVLRADPGTAGLPIIVLTARARTVDVETGYAVGATDYLVKPFSPAELVRRIENALAPHH